MLRDPRASSLEAAALLALAGGFLDGFTYVGHGHVFANAMTGNVVLLGVHFVSGAWQQAVRHIPPILAFLAGVWASQAIQLRAKLRGINAYLAVLLLEIAILSSLSFLPAAFPDWLFTLNIAFAASVQVQTFRDVNGHSYNSTFTTGNLRTLSEAAFSWLFEGHSPKSRDVLRDFSVICLAFLLGAMAGGYAVGWLGNHALWCEIAVLAFVATTTTRQPTVRHDREPT